MSGNKGASQFVTRFINKILKVLFTLLAKFVFHFLGATCVSLRTYTKMFTCKTETTKKSVFYIQTKWDTDYTQLRYVTRLEQTKKGECKSPAGIPKRTFECNPFEITDILISQLYIFFSLTLTVLVYPDLI